MGSCDPVEVFKGLVATRVKIEYAYYKLVDDMDCFMDIWGVGKVLCHTTAHGNVVVDVWG